MNEIQHILFPVDLSEECRLFAPAVRSIACRTGARVTLLHVLHLPPSYFTDSYGVAAQVDLEALIREERGRFAKFLPVELGDLPQVNRVFRHGDPGRMIAEYATQGKVDLIMMPTHGMGLFRRLLIGSVAAQVLHDTECPVWTAPHAPGPRPYSERYSKILCAVDLTDASPGVMQYGQDLAARFGAQIRFLHIVPSNEGLAMNYCDKEFNQALADMARERFAVLAKQIGFAPEVSVRSGDVAHAIRQEALDSDTDLIVIGRGVLKETLGRLRTQAYGIIRESPCAVLSV